MQGRSGTEGRDNSWVQFGTPPCFYKSLRTKKWRSIKWFFYIWKLYLGLDTLIFLWTYFTLFVVIPVWKKTLIICVMNNILLRFFKKKYMLKNFYGKYTKEENFVHLNKLLSWLAILFLMSVSRFESVE